MIIFLIISVLQVAGIVGRADLVCALSFLMAFLCYVRACHAGKFKKTVIFSRFLGSAGSTQTGESFSYPYFPLGYHCQWCLSVAASVSILVNMISHQKCCQPDKIHTRYTSSHAFNTVTFCKRPWVVNHFDYCSPGVRTTNIDVYTNRNYS